MVIVWTDKEREAPKGCGGGGGIPAGVPGQERSQSSPPSSRGSSGWKALESRLRHSPREPVPITQKRRNLQENYPGLIDGINNSCDSPPKRWCLLIPKMVVNVPPKVHKRLQVSDWTKIICANCKILQGILVAFITQTFKYTDSWVQRNAKKILNKEAYISFSK